MLAKQALHHNAGRLARHGKILLPGHGLADWGRVAELLLHRKAFIRCMPQSCPKGILALGFNLILQLTACLFVAAS